MALGNNAEPDHQGLRADAEDHQVGHHRLVEQGLAADLARRRLSPAATPRAAVRPPSARPATARRRRARSSATSPSPPAEIKTLVAKAARYTELGASAARPSSRRSNWPTASSSSPCSAPLIAKAAQAGQFVRVLPWDEGRADPADARRLGRQGRHHHLVVQAMGTSSIAINQHEGRRSLRRHRRSARPAERAAPLRRQPDGGVHRGRRRPAAGLSDHARASAPGQPRDADLGLPHHGPAVLDREDERVGRLQGGIRRAARRHLHQQRRQLRRQGLRHRRRSKRC